MSIPVSILKTKPLLPAEDYSSLRKEGINNIEKLGSSIWTEYNNSDPGITILEAVSYAITDLSYRTGFEIKDLLAPDKLDDKTWNNIFYTARKILHNSPLTLNDYRKMIIDVAGVRNAWIEPSKNYEVPIWIDYNYYAVNKNKDCSCEEENKICYGELGIKPVNPESYKANWESKGKELEDRKKIIESSIAGMIPTIEELEKNVGDKELEEKLIYIKKLLEADYKSMEDLDAEMKLLSRTIYPSKIVELEGLYNVVVEYEENLTEELREESRELIIRRLYRNRNLCEDFLSVNEVEYEDFGITATIILEEYADPDLVLALIFITIYKYFTPSVHFHTINQMQAKGYDVDEIFDGPPLKHGFIDSAELDKTSLFRDIRLSDIINELCDIKDAKGVKLIKAITFFHLIREDDIIINPDYFLKWIHELQNERKIAKVQPALSKVVFCKERDKITYYTGSDSDRRPERMLKLFKEFRSAENKYKLSGHQKDFMVPLGENMELEDYFPVTYSLPNCYGVNDIAGLPVNADEKRKIQALQLKGYLLMYEQMISDYLVQLNHLRELFSFDDSVKHTYFTKALADLDGLQELLIDYNDYGNEHFDKILNSFSHVVQNLVEDPKQFFKRRNKFLDHFLARFSENMVEYENISRWLTPYKVDERLVGDKIRILKDGEYYQVSSERGNGYDYSSDEFLDTNNISGTERRIGRFLGFKNIRRRSLVPSYILTEDIMEFDSKKNLKQKVNENGKPLNVIKIVDSDNNDELLLTSVESVAKCCTDLLITDILAHADNRRYYKFRNEQKFKSRKSADTGTYWFELYDGTEEFPILLAYSEKFNSINERDKAFKRLIEIIENINDNEGLHLIEHILLRPKFDEFEKERDGDYHPVEFLDICLDECDLGRGIDEGQTELPYLKRITRIPSEKCYDKMPWVLEYFSQPVTASAKSILYQQAFMDGTEPINLKFRRYESLVARIRDLQEHGSEEINYEIVSNEAEEATDILFSLIIRGDNRMALAHTDFIFKKKSEARTEIRNLVDYFSFQLNLYCVEDSCDHNEDSYSFRATILLPCWPKRFRDLTFRNLVEKTIATESPAHVEIRIKWIGISEMNKFENAYFPWLKEMSQTEMPSYDIVNPLVHRINHIKSCGCCTDDCSHSKAVVNEKPELK
ncbi:MAG: hypothetical protein IPP71_10370 [Bacteroidetes bacterium]|nr:hypothetical protein [Bacteroidota bacterium]